jgi:O-antigen/teichoic acid export membrane protein
VTTDQEMRTLVVRGVRWKATSQVLLQVLRVGVGVALARLLTPHDYGLAGMVIVFASLVTVFSDVALGAAIVQRPVITEDDRSTVFWTALGAGTLFTLIGVGLSWPIAAFYGQPSIQPMFAALSLTFVVTSIATTHNAILMREMSFKSLELRMMIAVAVAGAIGIAGAAAGWGAWAVIAQQLAVAAGSTALLWIFSPWRPRFVFSAASLKDFGGFSGNVFGQRLLYYVHANADNLLVGRFLGAAALGAYSVAYTVMLVPFSRIAVPLAEVLFPAMSRMQDDRERMAALWVRATRLIAVLTIPALLGMMVVAPDFVAVVLGHKWRSAAPVIQILSWVGLLNSLQTLNSNVLIALDRAQTLFRYTIVFFVAHMSAFVIGLHWGILGVAACYAISTTLVEPLYVWLTARAVGVSPRVFLRALVGPTQAALLMLAVLVPLHHMLVGSGIGPAARLGLCALAGTLVFVPACLWRVPEVLAEIRDLRSRRVRVRPAAEPA